MKFLIIRFSTMGDIVLTSPLVRCLRKQFPDAAIHFLADDACRPAIEFNPHIDKLHVLAHSVELMLEELKTEEYDHIIDLQHDSKSLLVSRSLKKKPLLISPDGFRSRFITRFTRLRTPHFADACFKAAATLKIKYDGGGLDYFIAANEETKKSDIPGAHYAGYIACGIGVSPGAKKWPAAKWKIFCEKLDHPIILMGSNEDAPIGNEIASTDPVKIYNACGKFSMNEMADLISKSKMFVTHENDLLHVAAAYKRPVISLWGHAASLAARYPYYGKIFLTGKQQLPFDNFLNRHIESIAVDDVLSAVKKRL